METCASTRGSIERGQCAGRSWFTSRHSHAPPDPLRPHRPSRTWSSPHLPPHGGRGGGGLVKELWKDTDSLTKPLSSDGARAVDAQRRQQSLVGWSPLLRPRAYPAVKSRWPGTCGPPERSLQTRTRVSPCTSNKPSGPGALQSLLFSSEDPMDMLRRRLGRRGGVRKCFY